MSGTTSAIYTDEDGDAHRFVLAGGTWTAPSGDDDILRGDPSGGWTLTHKDRSLETFDASGRLTSDADANGNSVLYEWSPDAW